MSRSARQAVGVVTGRSSFFDRVGGEAFFDALTRRFYAGVAEDPVLRPLYPDDEPGLEAARAHLCGFLVQFWGGPATYSAERGRPALRMRHAPFAIGPTERDAWVRHMTDAVRALAPGPLEEMQLIRYFEGAATQLINEPPVP